MAYIIDKAAHKAYNAAHHPVQKQMPLTDAFSRRLTYLRLSITDFCNFSCNYCLPNGYQGKVNKNELSLSEINTLLHAFATVGTKKVRITGGEPTIRKDFIDVIQTAKSINGINTVAMTSNGYKLHKHIAKLNQAGLTQLNLSIDSFNADVFKRITGANILPQLLKDIDQVLDTTDITLKLNGILMVETAYDTLIDALDFVKHRPVSYRFIEFMQTKDNSELFFAEHAQTDLIQNYLIQHGWQPVLVNKNNSSDGPAIEYCHPDYMGRIGLIMPYAKGFCDSCNRLRVNSQGQIHLCLFDQKNHDIRTHLQQNDVAGLVAKLQSFMPIKPEHHHLHNANSGMMNNLSMVGG